MVFKAKENGYMVKVCIVIRIHFNQLDPVKKGKIVIKDIVLWNTILLLLQFCSLLNNVEKSTVCLDTLF